MPHVQDFDRSTRWDKNLINVWKFVTGVYDRRRRSMGNVSINLCSFRSIASVRYPEFRANCTSNVSAVSVGWNFLYKLSHAKKLHNGKILRFNLLNLPQSRPETQGCNSTLASTSSPTVDTSAKNYVAEVIVSFWGSACRLHEHPICRCNWIWFNVVVSGLREQAVASPGAVQQGRRGHQKIKHVCPFFGFIHNIILFSCSCTCSYSLYDNDEVLVLVLVLLLLLGCV